MQISAEQCAKGCTLHRPALLCFIMGWTASELKGEHGERHVTRGLVFCTNLRHSASVNSSRLRTSDYSDEARIRLGNAVVAGREAIDFKFRPAFAKFAKVSLRSLADLEQGKPGVGETNLRAVARALPNWTKDTPRVILEDGPIPPTGYSLHPEPGSRVLLLVARLPPHEWTAEDRALIQEMSVDEITEFGQKLGEDHGQETQLRFLRAALDIKASTAAETPADAGASASNDQ